MSWGNDPKKWGKPITARMLPNQLQALEHVVAHRNKDLEPWETYRAQTKSSVIVDLVLREDAAIKAQPAAPSTRGTLVAQFSHERDLTANASRKATRSKRRTRGPKRKTRAIASVRRKPGRHPKAKRSSKKK